VDVVEREMPELHARLDALNFGIGAIVFNWYLSVFKKVIISYLIYSCNFVAHRFFNLYVQSNLPVELILRIWDLFLLEGRVVLFRYALALLKVNLPILLKVFL
jgi:hypothetical protein